MTSRRIRMVVVGGGAGGLELVKRLGARFGRQHDIVLVEKNATHIWKPLLHEVAAGSLDANLDEIGYREHCYRWHYRYVPGELARLERAQRRIILAPVPDEDGSPLLAEHAIDYDYLVLAIGSLTNDFGVAGVRRHCLFLDDRTEADRFRTRLLNHCLRVSRLQSADATGDAHVQVVIVGGGATGVELAAELYNAASALTHYGLEVFDESRLRVTLVEAGPRILPALPERLAEAAHAELEHLGVRILVNAQVVEATADAIVMRDGTRLPADLKVWAAGVRGDSLLASLDGLESSRNAQLVVGPTLQTTRDERVFALGDCCSCTLSPDSRPVPPRAQAAHQMAATVFGNLQRLMNGGPLQPFVYRDHGSLVSLSRFSTVGSLMGSLIGGRMAIEGRLARLFYVSLYRMHVVAVHGWLKGLALILVGRVNAIIRPRMKLH